MLLLLGFQAVYGYVYQQLAILIAFFMTGMSIGSWFPLRDRLRKIAVRPALRQLAGLQLLTAISPLLLYLFLSVLTGLRSPHALALVSWLLFPAAALLAGALGGYEFALVTEICLWECAHASRQAWEFCTEWT